MYEKLEKCLKENKVQNTVAICGWKDDGTGTLQESDPLYRSQKEFDFLIVSQPTKTIIHIEVKRSLSDQSMEKATKQLKNGLKMFREKIPFPEKENWKYTRVMYFAFERKGENETQFENSCAKCKHFIIGPTTDFNSWWKEIICLSQTNTEITQDQPDETYLSVLRFLLHQMYKQQVCTPGQLVDLTSKTSNAICNSDTIMFWSKEQYKTLKDFRNKKVALTSGFGTGKTILMRAKAKELIANRQKVVIVIFESTDKETVLKIEYQNIFETENSLVTVKSISGRTGN